jgi:hypothetical protein
MRINHLAKAVASRLGIPAVGAGLAIAMGVSPAAAATALPGGVNCATATNSTSGQTIQVCASPFVGVATNLNTLHEVMACAAQGGPVNVGTQLSCYVKDVGTGAIYGATSASSPGDVAVTASTFSVDLTTLVGPVQLCFTGSATDVNHNVVSVPLSCF